MAGLTAAKAYKHREAVTKSRLLWVLYRDGAIMFTVSALVVCSRCELTRRQIFFSMPSSSVQQFSFLTTTLGLRTMNLMIWLFGPLSLVLVGRWLLLSVDALLTAVS